MKSDDYLKHVAWGSYQTYSGPFFRGRIRYKIPENPTFWDKVLATLTATEGGAYDAINMYDRCILSVGLIQFCEAAGIFAVSSMLGACAEKNMGLLKSYLQEMPVACEVRRSMSGRWRMFLEGQEVQDPVQQRELYLGGASGLKGQWSEKATKHAKRVASVIAALWQEEEFQEVQLKFVRERLLGFAMPRSKAILFPKDKDYPKDGADGALRAAFLSFAGNLPAVADKHFMIAHESAEYQRAPGDVRLVLALKQMTFGPGIVIYPHRYNAIRPVLEREFGLDLPDFAAELEKFHVDDPFASRFPDVASFQNELMALGYDLGPAGADGVMGPKTRAAIEQFETDQGIPDPDGVPDSLFVRKLAAAQEKRVRDEEAVAEPPAVVDDEPIANPDEGHAAPAVPAASPSAVEARPADGSEKPSTNWVLLVVLVGGALAALAGKLAGLF